MQIRLKTLLFTTLVTASASLPAAPVGYSINSDSGTEFHDGLYRIDLATGQELERVGTVQSLLQTRLDVEGLAFAPDGTLYGIDDETLKLFPIDTSNGVVTNSAEVDIKGLTPRNNDFGMTFACDGKLYVTSVAKQSLYRMGLDGQTERIGAEGSLGVNISAIAAYGDPIQLYGLSNGTLGNNATSDAKIYRIDISDGTIQSEATLTGVDSYAEGGLAFDDAGQLWAITDRRPASLTSQVMKIDPASGAVSQLSATQEEGFESLAISIPRGCVPTVPEDAAVFRVISRFADENDGRKIDFSLSCNDGTDPSRTMTVAGTPGNGGEYATDFLVRDFADSGLECELTASASAGYSASSECFTESTCGYVDNGCTFTGVGMGQENLCVVSKRTQPVKIAVSGEWYYPADQEVRDENTTVTLRCQAAMDGNGVVKNGFMNWEFELTEEAGEQIAEVYPGYDGSTRCWTDLEVHTTAIDSVSPCENGFRVYPGDGTNDCIVSNTIFYEGIPTLSRSGILLFAALMLLTGLVATRRF